MSLFEKATTRQILNGMKPVRAEQDAYPKSNKWCEPNEWRDTVYSNGGDTISERIYKEFLPDNFYGMNIDFELMDYLIKKYPRVDKNYVLEHLTKDRGVSDGDWKSEEGMEIIHYENVSR